MHLTFPVVQLLTSSYCKVGGSILGGSQKKFYAFLHETVLDDS